MHGAEVLARIKEDESPRMIPTVVLAASEEEADVVKSFELQANCYLHKPVKFEALEMLVKSLNDFWLTKARFPAQC